MTAQMTTEERRHREAIARYLSLASALMANMAAITGDNTHLQAADAVRTIGARYDPASRPPDPRFEYIDET